jgi:hypothetical protein
LYYPNDVTWLYFVLADLHQPNSALAQSDWELSKKGGCAQERTGGISNTNAEKVDQTARPSRQTTKNQKIN